MTIQNANFALFETWPVCLAGTHTANKWQAGVF